MGEEQPKDTDEISRLPRFPAEARDLPESRGGRPRWGGRGWRYGGLVFGAGIGLTCGGVDSFGWFRLPGQLLGRIFGDLPGMPEWVFTWVCPIIGWAVVGGLAGWALDAYRAERDRAD